MINKAIKTIKGNEAILQIYGGFVSDHTFIKTEIYLTNHTNVQQTILDLYQAEIVEIKQIFTYEEAFEKFIIGQKIVRYYCCKVEFNYCYGVLLENDYKLLNYGFSGVDGDCVNTYILDIKDNLIAKLEN